MINQIQKAIYYYLLPQSWAYKQGSKRNIALFASRRGGSSILSELLTSGNNVREIDQPFDTFQTHTREGRAKIANLPAVELSQYFDLSPQQWAQVDAYMQKILSGGLRDVSLPAFNLKTRTLLKLVNTPFLLDDFKQKYNLQVVYMGRHPIPQALSVMRNKWGITVPAYLNPQHQAYMSQFINQDQLEFARNIMQKDNYFEQAILNWVFENMFALNFAKHIDIKTYYEHLVENPEQVIPQLENILDLKINSDMLNRPSRSSPLSDQKTLAAIGKDKTYLLTKWRDSVDKSQITAAQQILDKFNVLDYNADEHLPITR
jgi:hypothetical protein